MAFDFPRKKRRSHIWWLLLFAFVFALPMLRSVSWPWTVPELDVSTIGRFSLDERTGTAKDIPADLRSLDGRRVKVVGYPWLIDDVIADSRVNDFQIIAPFGVTDFGPPLVQGRVFAKAKPRDFVIASGMHPFSGLTVTTGIFHVNPVRDPDLGKIVSVFQLDAERIDPYPTPPTSPKYGWLSLIQCLSVAGFLITLLVMIFSFRRETLRRLAGHCRNCGYEPSHHAGSVSGMRDGANRRIFFVAASAKGRSLNVNTRVSVFQISDFLPSDFLRISGFGFRIFPQ